MTEYTAQEVATLQSRLDKQLGPEYVSTRPGAGGGKVHYLAAEKAINLANEVFGFNGWSSSVQNMQIDFVDENPQNGKITLGLSATVRVTLRDGTYHEDIGYGHTENVKGKAAAFDKAKKEGVTDGLKRALRNFGNVLGNCLYDKDYLQKVTKVKVAPSRWDADNLHRHPEYAPIKKESIADADAAQNTSVAARRQSSAQSNNSYGSIELEDDFGGAFDETDFSHPGEVMLEGTVTGMETPAKRAINGPQNVAQQRQGVPRTHSMPQIRPPNLQSPAAVQNIQPPQKPQALQRPPNIAAQPPPNRMPPPQANTNHQRPAQSVAAPVQTSSDGVGSKSNPSSATASDSPSTTTTGQQQLPQHRQAAPQTTGGDLDEQSFPVPRQPPPGIPEGFVTGRSADLLNQPSGARPINSNVAFNPHADTPSIRRTQGVNPGRSAPVMRQALGSTVQQAQPALGPGPPPPQHAVGNGMNGAAAPVRTNFVNPSADMNRRIGMPPSATSHTMQNRGTYKPPTPLKRPPLADVSNLQGMDGASDPKKAKLEQSAAPAAGNDGQSAVPVPAGPPGS